MHRAGDGRRPARDMAYRLARTSCLAQGRPSVSAWCLSRSCASSAWSSSRRASSAGTRACTAATLPCVAPQVKSRPGVPWHTKACQVLCGAWGLQPVTALVVSSNSCSEISVPSCAAGTGSAPRDCAAQRPPSLQCPEQQATRAWPACQLGRAARRTLAPPAPSCCPRLSWTRLQASFALVRAARLLLIWRGVPLALQAGPGPAKAMPSSTP